MVLIGSRGYGYEKIKKWIFENRAGDWVHELGWLTSEDTAKLVCGASALISLSRAEGFGLTILEALACGTSVLASDIPAHREVGKDYVTYTVLNDLDDSVNKLINLLNQSTSYSTDKLTNYLTEYSWYKSASQTLDVLASFSR